MLLGAVLAIAVAVHLPSLHLGFVSDDFQWWQHAHMARARPALLLAPFGGYRPANTWLLALDDLVFRTNPSGYHATNLALHVACGVLFWLVLRRFALGRWARAGLVTLWLCSPYTLEPVLTIANRFSHLLLASWLGLVLVWPGRGEKWTRAKSAGAIALSLLTVAAEEAWVVLPLFFLAYEWFVARRTARESLRVVLAAACAAALYVAIYFHEPPIAPEGYFSAGLEPLAKVPHAWATFAGLSSLHPVQFPFGLRETLGLAAMLGLGWAGWRQRAHLIGLGFAFFLLPLLPVLPVPFMTTRYTAIPYAGFLMVMAGAARLLSAAVPPMARHAAAAGFSATIAAVLFWGLTLVSGDMSDARRCAAAYARPVAEFRRFAVATPPDRVIVAVRLEGEDPLPALADTSAGVPKLYFARPKEPYSLADWAALLSYCLEPVGGPVFVAGDAASDGRTDTYAVIGHISGAFVSLSDDAPTAAAAFAAWTARGVPVRLLKPWHP